MEEKRFREQLIMQLNRLNKNLSKLNEILEDDDESEQDTFSAIENSIIDEAAEISKNIRR